jgi:hypothetical protein
MQGLGALAFLQADKQLHKALVKVALVLRYAVLFNHNA